VQEKVQEIFWQCHDRNAVLSYNFGFTKNHKMHIAISTEEWAILAHNEAMQSHANKPLTDCRFHALFGMSAKLCSWYWQQLDLWGLLPWGFMPEHFLWTIHFLHAYCTEETNCTWFGCTETMFRKWVWQGVAAIGSLRLVHTHNDLAYWKMSFSNYAASD